MFSFWEQGKSYPYLQDVLSCLTPVKEMRSQVVILRGYLVDFSMVILWIVWLWKNNWKVASLAVWCAAEQASDGSNKTSVFFISHVLDWIFSFQMRSFTEGSCKATFVCMGSFVSLFFYIHTHTIKILNILIHAVFHTLIIAWKYESKWDLTGH